MAKQPVSIQNKGNSTHLQAIDRHADVLEPFQGVDAIANRLFDTESVGHRTLLLRHEGSPPSFSTGFELSREICSKIEQNFAAILKDAMFLNDAMINRSRENWRLVSPGTKCAEENKAREVGLERALVAACQSQGRTDWWNQVPVASGLLGGRAGRKRAIDLVHRRSDKAYDFVELKLDSDTPIYAAIEIMEYGLLWLFSRQARSQLRYTHKNLLDAEDVVLSVLALPAFYGNADYRAFGEGINAALRDLGTVHNVTLGFRFSRFSADFHWTGNAEKAQLCQMLDRLYPGIG
jgi:hypothetical protein